MLVSWTYKKRSKNPQQIHINAFCCKCITNKYQCHKAADYISLTNYHPLATWVIQKHGLKKKAPISRKKKFKIMFWKVGIMEKSSTKKEKTKVVSV